MSSKKQDPIMAAIAKRLDEIIFGSLVVQKIADDLENKVNVWENYVIDLENKVMRLKRKGKGGRKC